MLVQLCIIHCVSLHIPSSFSVFVQLCIHWVYLYILPSFPSLYNFVYPTQFAFVCTALYHSKSQLACVFLQLWIIPFVSFYVLSSFPVFAKICIIHCISLNILPSLLVFVQVYIIHCLSLYILHSLLVFVQLYIIHCISLYILPSLLVFVQL